MPGLKQLPYEEGLECLGLWTLEERRNEADILEVFRMYKGWSTTSFDTFFTLNTGLPVLLQLVTQAKLMKNRCCLDMRHHFFSERVVNR